MSIIAADAPAIEPPPRGRSLFGAIWRTTEGKLGLLILVAFLVVIAAGPYFAPYPPTEIGVGGPSEGPSWSHLLGTDGLSRDVLSRLLYGGRSVIWIPLLGTILAFVVGGTLGMLAGYRGGLSDTVSTRGLDILLALPPLLMVAVIITTVGSSTPVLVVCVAAVFAPRVARILRGATQGVATQEFVAAAQARGERSTSIVGREILPNITPTVLVEFAVRLTYAIIFVATLNFLGLGLQPPSPSWGVMVSESRQTVDVAPFATIAPAVAIATVSVGISLIADAFTQALSVDERVELL